jgi:uncharacterized protein YuzE
LSDKSSIQAFKNQIPPPVFLAADGTQLPFLPANGETFTLGELQRAVGGLIETIYLGDDLIMAIDEDGKIKGKPVNPEATRLAQPGLYIFEGDEIVGDAAVLPSRMLP